MQFSLNQVLSPPVSRQDNTYLSISKQVLLFSMMLFLQLGLLTKQFRTSFLCYPEITQTRLFLVRPVLFIAQF